ncbi:MAG: ABC transporter permease [Bacillota bacterium]|nr:ABC transporter permease [Bacillota bacterium]
MLGFTNARRNLGRSVMAVLGAAVAAMIMTSIISLSGGYPAQGWIEARTFLGADILVFATKHLVGPEDLRPDKVQVVGGAAEPARWAMASLSPNVVCDLMTLQPELYAQGFISPGGAGARPIDIEDLRRTLSGDPRITQVVPSFFLPIRLTYEYVLDDQLYHAELPQAVLRARDFTVQASGGLDFGQLLVGDSRCPTPDEQHGLVGLLDASLGLLGYHPPNPDTPRLMVWVPAVSIGADGQVSYDFLRETAYEIDLVGQYATRTGAVSWQTPKGDYMHEDLFWVTPQLQIPAGAFADIWAGVSGGMPLDHAVQVGLRVDRLAYVEDIATELRRLLPAYSVVSVPQQMELAHVRGLPEASFSAPIEMLGGTDIPQTGLPVDLSRTFFVLVCLVAALLMATNLLFLVSERRKEIGILKAIGARGTDVALMILTEALTLNLLGTLLGFGLIRILATWTMISNRIPIAEIGRATANDFAVVMSAAALAAALFGMLPAWQMARLTSMEVLRND